MVRKEVTEHIISCVAFLSFGSCFFLQGPEVFTDWRLIMYNVQVPIARKLESLLRCFFTYGTGVASVEKRGGECVFSFGGKKFYHG